MKHFLLAFFSLLIFSFAGKAQQYETLTDSLHPKEKILKGIISKSDLANNPDYNKWYTESQKIYPVPNEDAVKGMRKNKDNINIVIFGGTWCEDTQNLLPKFYQLIDKSGYPETKIILIAVDRQKTTVNNLHITYNITNVPTFIVLKDGKEVGRVVEYGKGDMVKELGEIVGKL